MKHQMFQEFLTCLFDNSLFPIWIYVNALFFKINSVVVQL